MKKELYEMLEKTDGLKIVTVHQNGTPVKAFTLSLPNGGMAPVLYEYSIDEMLEKGVLTECGIGDQLLAMLKEEKERHSEHAKVPDFEYLLANAAESIYLRPTRNVPPNVPVYRQALDISLCPSIIVDMGDAGTGTTWVTNQLEEKLIEKHGSREELIKMAEENLLKQMKVTSLYRIMMAEAGEEVPDKENWSEADSLGFYVGNEDNSYSAGILLASEMARRVALHFAGGAFYVDLSCIHSAFVMPMEKVDEEKFRELIRSQTEGLHPRDRLSDNVYYCDDDLVLHMASAGGEEPGKEAGIG